MLKKDILEIIAGGPWKLHYSNPTYASPYDCPIWQFHLFAFVILSYKDVPKVSWQIYNIIIKWIFGY